MIAPDPPAEELGGVTLGRCQVCGKPAVHEVGVFCWDHAPSHADQTPGVIETFYLGSNYNIADRPRIDVARALIRDLEDVTGWRCTSRWPWSAHHGGQAVGSTRAIMAATDLADIRGADAVLIVPLNGTARGCHVEMGAAFAWDKPTYLYRPFGGEGTAFDALCTDFPTDWKQTIVRVLRDMEIVAP